MTTATTARLSATAAAPSIARYRAREVCRRERVGATQQEATAVVAGELVGISVRQARAALDLDILVQPRCVEIRIRELPTIGRLRPDGLSTARSLELVRRTAQSWGIDFRGDDRVLWAIVSLDLADSRSDEPTCVLVRH